MKWLAFTVASSLTAQAGVLEDFSRVERLLSRPTCATAAGDRAVPVDCVLPKEISGDGGIDVTRVHTDVAERGFYVEEVAAAFKVPSSFFYCAIVGEARLHGPEESCRGRERNEDRAFQQAEKSLKKAGRIPAIPQSPDPFQDPVKFRIYRLGVIAAYFGSLSRPSPALATDYYNQVLRPAGAPHAKDGNAFAEHCASRYAPDPAKTGYITRDGNYRHFWNPQSQPSRIDYSYGSTSSPFQSLDEIREKTPVPTSLGGSDFYANYANVAPSAKITEDPATGNRYYDHSVGGQMPVDQVNFKEQNKFWNVYRFFIAPHYAQFGVNEGQAELNAWTDIYRYYLFVDHGDRKAAWKHSQDFMKEYVEPVVKGKFVRWKARNIERIQGQKPSMSSPGQYTNALDAQSPDYLLELVLNHNEKVLSHQRPGPAISRADMLETLVAFQTEIRRVNPAEAQQLAEAAIAKKEAEVRAAIQDLQGGKREAEIYTGTVPADLYSRDPINQQTFWDDEKKNHPDRWKKVVQDVPPNYQELKVQSRRRFVD